MSAASGTRRRTRWSRQAAGCSSSRTSTVTRRPRMSRDWSCALCRARRAECTIGTWTRRLFLDVRFLPKDTEEIDVTQIAVFTETYDQLRVEEPVRVRYVPNPTLPWLRTMTMTRLESQRPLESLLARLDRTLIILLIGIGVWLILLMAWSKWRRWWLALCGAGHADRRGARSQQQLAYSHTTRSTCAEQRLPRDPSYARPHRAHAAPCYRLPPRGHMRKAIARLCHKTDVIEGCLRQPGCYSHPMQRSVIPYLRRRAPRRVTGNVCSVPKRFPLLVFLVGKLPDFRHRFVPLHVVENEDASGLRTGDGGLRQGIVAPCLSPQYSALNPDASSSPSPESQSSRARPQSAGKSAQTSEHPPACPGPMSRRPYHAARRR
jgi:hypothetical protein